MNAFWSFATTFGRHLGHKRLFVGLTEGLISQMKDRTIHWQTDEPVVEEPCSTSNLRVATRHFRSRFAQVRVDRREVEGQRESSASDSLPPSPQVPGFNFLGGV
jgi:hypothetical protein